MAGWSQARERHTLVFAVSDNTSEVVTAYYGFLSQAYDRIGYDITMLRLPNKRAYCNADLDRADGLLLAPASILEKYKNLIAIPVPLRQVELAAYARNISFKVNGFESLRPYRIGFIRGYPVSERMTESMDRQMVNTFQSLFSMLDLGRIDIALGLKRETERFLAAHPEFTGVGRLEPSLMILNIYHLVHKRHKALIPLLTPVMEELLEEGLLDVLYAPFEKQEW